MWSVSDGKELAVVSGRGIGVRLCVFFADNVRVASAQEKAVLVSVHVLVVMIIAVCAGSQPLPSLSSSILQATESWAAPENDNNVNIQQ